MQNQPAFLPGKPSRKVTAASSISSLVLIGIALAFGGLVFGFELLPAWRLFLNSLIHEGHISVANFVEILSDPYYLQSVRNSLFLSLTSSLAGVAAGGISAYVFATSSPGLRARMMLITSITSNFAGVPLALGYMVLLGSNGIITLLLRSWFGFELYEHFSLYSWAGLSLAYLYFQLPLATLLIFPAIYGLRREWKEASATLGGSAFDFWYRIGLRVLFPSLVSTFVILMANSLGAYATAYALTSGTYNLLALRIAFQIQSEVMYNPGLAAALSVVLGTMMMACLAIRQYATRVGRKWQ